MKKKFSLLRYLDPYDSFDDLSALEADESERLRNMKNSKICRNTLQKLSDMITSLQSIETAMLKGDVLAVYALKDKDLHDVKRIIKRLRKKYMQLLQVKSTVAAKKYKKNYKS